MSEPLFFLQLKILFNHHRQVLRNRDETETAPLISLQRLFNRAFSSVTYHVIAGVQEKEEMKIFMPPLLICEHSSCCAY